MQELLLLSHQVTEAYKDKEETLSPSRSFSSGHGDGHTLSAGPNPTALPSMCVARVILMLCELASSQCLFSLV